MENGKKWRVSAAFGKFTKNGYFINRKWDVKTRVAMFFHELNEWKNLQRDFDSPILS